MTLSDDRVLFGIHSIAPYDRTTGEFFGILKVLGDSELSLAASAVQLFGGANKFPIADETTQINSQFTSAVKSAPDFLFEKWIGASVATIAAAALGTVGTITNKKGTSAVSATVGIASVNALSGSEDDLATGHYIVKVVTATTVDVYVDTDIDFSIPGATSKLYVNDLLKITVTPLTVPDSGSTVTIPDYGLELVGGSGTVAMTVDDTAEFDAVAEHGGISDITLGQATITLPEFGFFAYGARRADNSIFRIHAFKAKSSTGMVVPLSEGAFMITNLVTTLLYDNAQDAVAIARAVAGA